MATTGVQADSIADPTSLYTQLDTYPWATDEDFQGGLHAILGSVNEPSQVEHLTLRAKCYYYARKAGTPVDFDGYKKWVEGNHTGTGNASSQEQSLHEANSTAVTNDESTVDATTAAAAATTTAPAGNGMADAPRPATFAEICDMIAEGKPIPGIKDIPDTILEGQASSASQAQRRKPWERDELRAVAAPSWIT